MSLKLLGSNEWRWDQKVVGMIELKETRVWTREKEEARKRKEKEKIKNSAHEWMVSMKIILYVPMVTKRELLRSNYILRPA